MTRRTKICIDITKPFNEDIINLKLLNYINDVKPYIPKNVSNVTFQKTFNTEQYGYYYQGLKPVIFEEKYRQIKFSHSILDFTQSSFEDFNFVFNHIYDYLFQITKGNDLHYLGYSGNADVFANFGKFLSINTYKIKENENIDLDKISFNTVFIANGGNKLFLYDLIDNYLTKIGIIILILCKHKYEKIIAECPKTYYKLYVNNDIYIFIYNNTDISLGSIINLGSECSLIYQINNITKQPRYPFDWLSIRDFNSVYDCLSNNFDEFCGPLEFIKESANHKLPDGTNAHIYKNKYGMTFNHDFGLGNHDTVIEAYKRRIGRFYRYITSCKTLTLMRVVTKKVESEIVIFKKIRKLLMPYNRYIECTLVVIGADDDVRVDDHIVKVIYISEKRFEDWHRDNLDWSFLKEYVA